MSPRKYKIFPISNGIKMNRGMTYVELIVVLSIFSVMSSVVLFNYNKFEEKVDIKILANDIALKIVEAQKSSVSGIWNLNAPANWKPAYGLYFNSSPSNSFISFADFDNDNAYDVSSCPGGECLILPLTITKNNRILKIGTYTGNTLVNTVSSPLSLTFKRPNPGAVFAYSDGVPLTGFDYVQVTISSPSALNSCIKVYSSGRIQIGQCVP